MKGTLNPAITLNSDTIDGFSYSFTKSLLRKLSKLNEEKRIFIKDENGITTDLTTISFSVIYHLQNQIHTKIEINQINVDQLIETVKEFLQIFDEKEIPEHICLDTLIEKTKFSTRVKNSLRRVEIKTIRDLTEANFDLISIKGFGRTCLEEVKRKLADSGISLKTRFEK